MSETICQKCGDYYDCRPECEPTTFCDTCAQSIVSHMEELMSPGMLTLDEGAQICAALQREIYDRPYAPTPKEGME